MTITCAFWIFDLGDKFFKTETKHEIINPDGTAASQTVIEDMPVISEASADTTPSKQLLTPRQNTPIRVDIEESRLADLEKKLFEITAGGTAYLGDSGMSKKATFYLKMKPVLGTTLQTFEVMEARIVLDNSAVSLASNFVRIQNRDVEIGLLSKNDEPFVMWALLDEPILQDKNNKQSIVIKNQPFYLVKKDIPYRLDLAGIMIN